MRRTILLLAVVPIVLVLATPAAAGNAPPVEVLVAFHANPVTCDAPIGAIPAGPVDVYFPRPDNRLAAGWATPAGSTTGPWVLVQSLYLHADWYTLNASGTGPGDWLFETELVWPTKTGLLGSVVTCHNAAPQYMDDEDAWYWVDAMVEILVLPRGK